MRVRRPGTPHPLGLAAAPLPVAALVGLLGPRYGIDFYGELRWYELDEAANPDLKNITVGIFGKFVF